jgi:hypothetical protein
MPPVFVQLARNKEQILLFWGGGEYFMACENYMKFKFQYS